MVLDTSDNIALSLSLSLKISDGRGGIDSEDIRRLTRQKIVIPTSISELEHHLNHDIHILAIMTCQKSFPVYRLTTLQEHIKMNYGTYSDLLRQRNMFATKVLYIVDLRMQIFFKNAQQGNITPDILEFSQIYRDIIQNRFFNARLSDAIISKKRKNDDRDNQDGGTNSNGRPRRDDKGAWVKNLKINLDWKIKQGEDYGKIIHQP